MVLFASPGAPSGAEKQADVAQLVERNLAKVEVASSSLVVRSERVSSPSSGGLAERRGNGLQIRVHGFKSRTHLDSITPPRAIGAAVARFLDTEEVTGSNPVSPTSNTQVRGRFPGGNRPRAMKVPPGRTHSPGFPHEGRGAGDHRVPTLEMSPAEPPTTGDEGLGMSYAPWLATPAGGMQSRRALSWDRPPSHLR